MAYADIQTGARAQIELRDLLRSDAQSRSLSASASLMLRRFFGLVFVIAAIGLWVAPGANWGADVLLLKTGLTGVLSLSAIAALLSRD